MMNRVRLRPARTDGFGARNQASRVRNGANRPALAAAGRSPWRAAASRLSAFSQQSPRNAGGAGPIVGGVRDRSRRETPVNSTLLWYTTRGAGVVSMVLLSGVMALGMLTRARAGGR